MQFPMGWETFFGSASSAPVSPSHFVSLVCFVVTQYQLLPKSATPEKSCIEWLIHSIARFCSEPLCDFYMPPGILDERMYAFVAQGLEFGDPAREAGEVITNFPVTIDQLFELLRTGQVKDSKSLSALLYYALNHFQPEFSLGGR
jgi:hypothetical protein